MSTVKKFLADLAQWIGIIGSLFAVEVIRERPTRDPDPDPKNDLLSEVESDQLSQQQGENTP
jgi:hypothetical protein